MKYTPESLLDIFMNGSLTADAQTAFDRLMRENPEFSEKVTQAMAERMGPVPSSTVEEVSSRLDAKFESLWIKNKPSKWARYFRLGTKGLVAIGVIGFLGYALSILWPKLMAALPQIDLARTNSIESVPAPKAETAAPIILAPSLLKTAPAVVKVAQVPIIVPTPVPTAVPAVKPNFNTQTGNSIRLVMDNDKARDVVVTVLDPSGTLVRHLYLGHWDPGSHFIDWDGRNDLGATVAPGNYTIVVKSGSKTQSGVVTIQPNR